MTTDDRALLAALSEPELYERLGELLALPDQGIGPFDRAWLRSFGQRWFDERRAQFQRVVCSSDFAKLMIDSTGSQAVDRISIIADALLDRLNRPTGILVAVIITRIGLERFCSKEC